MQELLKYQELDLKLKKLESELASSVNKKNAGEMQQYLRDGQAKLVKLEESAKVFIEQYNKSVTLYNEFVGKLETLSKEVEGANEEQLTNLENLIKKFSVDAEKLDNHIANISNKISTINKEFENLMNNAKKARHNLEIYKTNYAKEREKLDPEIDRIKKALDVQKKAVNSTLLNKYLAKSEGKNIAVFVKEAGGRCSGCRMEIPAGKLSDLRTKGMVECENCGRIIYS